MSTTPTPVEDDLDTGRMIASRWRPATLRTTPSKQDRGLFGHPRGLPWMLNVEMWERFSYYGMRAILLYFITDTVARGGLGLSANSGQVILASYSAAVYLLAIPGGIFADRIIGPWLSTLSRPRLDGDRAGGRGHRLHQAEPVHDRRGSLR